MNAIRTEITFVDGETVTYKGLNVNEDYEHDGHLYLAVQTMDGEWSLFPLDSIKYYVIMRKIYNWEGAQALSFQYYRGL